MVLTLFWKNKTKVQPGIGFTSKKVLQYAVILLGFGLNLSEIAKVGAQSLPIIVSTISTSLIVSVSYTHLCVRNLSHMPQIDDQQRSAGEHPRGNVNIHQHLERGHETENRCHPDEPITLPIAMSFCPLRAATMEVTSSGRLVPMATMVRPMSVSLRPNIRAMRCV